MDGTNDTGKTEERKKKEEKKRDGHTKQVFFS
jgi:hypothetical protein